jgi:uncharacterized protein YbcC (UPF0753/DUF2309 family)
MHSTNRFDEHHLLHNLKHYLPAQAPLKDFVHHNTLHEFQDQKFHDGLAMASKMFGYRVYLSFSEYQKLYEEGKINREIIKRTIEKLKGKDRVDHYLEILFKPLSNQQLSKRIGKLRSHWKDQYQFDLNARVHVNIFRILNSFLDQGVALWAFPLSGKSLLEAVRELDKNSFKSFFRTDRARVLLHDEKTNLKELLNILVGDENLFEHYVFDQQFEHPGWSGLVATIEEQPHTLLDARKISLKELVLLELIFEIDTLDHRFGSKWKPLANTYQGKVEPLFSNYDKTLFDDLYAIWQESYEWTFYNEVIKGLQTKRNVPVNLNRPSFQGIFCIDDREISLREYLENLDPNCETFSTAGHFGIDTYFRPLNGKFHTKICPLPVNPKHIICEESGNGKNKKDVHFNKRAHGLLGGWVIAQTVGFWSAFKLFINVFKPTISPASASSFRHMESDSLLTIENKNLKEKVNGYQVGYTIYEMADRVETVLRSIGLTENFAPLIYVTGHGASSTNNTHFAAYDCGACSGRPGSVNARAFSYMANHAEVRKIISERGISIPDDSLFVGGLHDTTCDDVHYYDLEKLSTDQRTLHSRNLAVIQKALSLNAKERSRRFDLVNTKNDPETVHKRVRLRAVSLFEPRPEYNHATNTLCIVGRRSLTQKLNLDRRSFLNSYDYRIDPDGKYLLGILNAAAPVCGGINLEYYFSRVDNHKLGAGSKLPHNVMGLIGVANGIEGDLRPGLPQQMIEIHDPLRLLIVVEQKPDVVLKTIQVNPATYEWFKHEWVHLVVFDPFTEQAYQFRNEQFELYAPIGAPIAEVSDYQSVIEGTCENLPVFTLKKQLV